MLLSLRAFYLAPMTRDPFKQHYVATVVDLDERDGVRCASTRTADENEQGRCVKIMTTP